MPDQGIFIESYSLYILHLSYTSSSIPGTNGFNLTETFPSIDGYPLGATCNDNCSCPLNMLVPICGTDDVTYLNPCFAGCTLPSFTEKLVRKYIEIIIYPWFYCRLTFFIKTPLKQVPVLGHCKMISKLNFGNVEKFCAIDQKLIVTTMDDSSYRLNFDLGKKNEIHHYS